MNTSNIRTGTCFGARRWGQLVVMASLLLLGACTSDLGKDFGDDPLSTDLEAGAEGGLDDDLADDPGPADDPASDDRDDDPGPADDLDDVDDADDADGLDDSDDGAQTDDSTEAGADDFSLDDPGLDDPGPDDSTDDPSGGLDGGVGGEGGPPSGFVIVGSVPEHGAIDVELDSDLSIEFSRDVQPMTGFVTLVESVTSSPVEEVSITDMARVVFDGVTVSVDWETLLSASTSYSVVLDTGAIVDLEGVAFDGLTTVGELSFSTRAPGALSLSSTFPLHESSGVDILTDIVLSFSEEVTAGQTGMLSIIAASDLELVQSVLVSDTTATAFDEATLTVQLPEPLEYSTDYFVTLDADAVQSRQGAGYAGFADDSVLAFSTAPPPPLLLMTTTPMDGAEQVDPDTVLVFTFNDLAMIGAGNINVFASADDSLVESVAVTDPGVMFSDATMTVDLPATLADATDYYVNVDAGAVESPLGGAFAGLSGATDFSFTTADAPPTPLVLESTVPQTGAAGVATGANLVFNFNEEIRFGSGNITIFAEDGTAFEVISVTSARVTVSGSSATVNPVEVLSGNTTYYVLLTAGCFESVDGASFAGVSDPQTFRFTTENTFSLVSRAPADDETGVHPATDLVLSFSDDVAAGSGAVTVYDAMTDAVLESVPIGDRRVTLDTTDVIVDIDGLLDGSRNYYVLVDAGAIVQSDGGTSYAGTSTPTQWNFTVRSVSRPGGVSAGLVLWLDGNYSASVVTDSGVRYWADRSGQHNDVANDTAAQQPTSAAGINGLDVVRFDGSNDRLLAQVGLNLTAVEGFIVWESPIVPRTDARGLLLLNGQNLEVNHSHEGGAASTVAAFTGSWHTARFNPTPTANTEYLWHFGFDSVTTSLLASTQGGALAYQTGPSTTPVQPATPLSIGGASQGCTGGCAFNGEIGEVILYSRRLSQTERLAVVEYLRDKWDIPQVSCGSGEVRGDNGSCYFLQQGTNNWNGARGNCQGRGAGWDLATVRSQLDHDEIASILSATSVSNAWLGASDAEVPDTWRWVNDTLQFWNGGSVASGGVPSNGSFAAWRDGEPSRGDIERCGRYNLTGGAWTWADGSCDDAHPAICEGPGD